jgi:hypothetical protein
MPTKIDAFFDAVNYLIGSCNVYQSNQAKKINYDGVDAEFSTLHR